MAKKTTAKKTDFSKYIKWFWISILGGILSVILLFLLASWGAFGPLPTFEELENPEHNLATEIISSDGKTLGKYYNENRTPVQYKDLPANLIEALSLQKTNDSMTILELILEQRLERLQN